MTCNTFSARLSLCKMIRFMDKIEHSIVRASFLHFCFLVLHWTGMEFESGGVLCLIRATIWEPARPHSPGFRMTVLWQSFSLSPFLTHPRSLKLGLLELINLHFQWNAYFHFFLVRGHKCLLKWGFEFTENIRSWKVLQEISGSWGNCVGRMSWDRWRRTGTWGELCAKVEHSCLYWWHNLF